MGIDKVIKGPFSYSGNKYRIYKKVLCDIMSNFDKIHEPFLGSGACIYNSNNGGIGMDIDMNVISLHNSMSDKKLIDKIKSSYEEYFPNGRNKDSYLKLRSDFNKSYLIHGTGIENVHLLHILVQLSFNSLLRFSKNGFNVPMGMKEVDFGRIELHMDVFNSKELVFIHGVYKDIDLSQINKDRDLIYLDPPYIASKFQYGGWNREQETELLSYLDNLNDRGYKFILSNTFNHRGVTNDDLIEWSVKYKTRDIKKKYNSWAAAVTSVKYEENTSEVIIYNFDIDI